MVVDLDAFADRLAGIPGVVAVALGGSRARGAERPDSDWDLALYYRRTIDPDDVRALGYQGTVVAPGEWAYPMNGGAWLSVDGEKVDLLYRTSTTWSAGRVPPKRATGSSSAFPATSAACRRTP